MDYEFKPIRIKAGDKTYIYDFNELSVEQAELAMAVGEWKVEQMQSAESRTFSDFEKSGGADWLFLINSYLMTEEINGRIIPFLRSNVKEIEKDLRKIKVKEANGLKESVQDFFQNTGNGEFGLKLLNGKRKQSVWQELLPLIAGMSSNENKNIL